MPAPTDEFVSQATAWRPRPPPRVIARPAFLPPRAVAARSGAPLHRPATDAAMSPTPVSKPVTALSPRARKTVFAAVASLAVVAGGLVWGAFGSRGAPPPAPPPPVPVTTMRVERRDVPHWQDTIGTVTSLQSTVLRPQVDGVLTEVLFREGQQVKRGQLLARIDDRSIAANLDGAQAALARDAAQLRAAKSDLERFRQLSGSQLIARQMLEQQ